MTPALSLLSSEAVTDPGARLVLSDALEESGNQSLAELVRCPVRGPSVAGGLLRPEVMRLWLDELPARDHKTRKRVDSMTDAESAQTADWAKKWIAIGLSTERADRPLFEAAVHACYRYSNLAPPKWIIWAPGR